MKKWMIVLLPLLFFLVGCAQSEKPVSSTENVNIEITVEQTSTVYTPLLQATDTSEPLATDTPEPISIPELVGSPTPAPTKIIGTYPNPLPGFGIQKNCIFIEEMFINQTILTGTLILDSENPSGYEPPYLINLANNEKITLPTSSEGKVRLALDGSAVSPNKRLFAYVENFFDPSINDNISDTALRHQYEDAQHELRIITADGQLQSIPNWQSEWGWITDWPDEQKLLFAPSVSVQDAGTIAVLNPVTGQHQILSPTFPSIEPSSISWYPFTNIPLGIYDPALDQVLYLNFEQGITLWDNLSRDILWAMPGTPIYKPKWSPTGNHILFAKDTSDVYREPRFEFFLVNREGELTQLTHFADAYPNLDISLGDFSWSPNGQKVAFWLLVDTGEYYEEHLAILDIEPREVIETCLPGLKGGGGALAPVWSPDGKMLAVESAYFKGFGKEGRKVFLVDLEFQYAVQILEDVGPVGWMGLSP